MREAVATFKYERAIAIAKQLALTLSFAIAYIALTALSPVPAKSSWMGLVFGKVVRVANGLRAFQLVTPAALIGTAAGAGWLNRADGPVGLSKPAVLLAMGLGVMWLTKRWGRSKVKDVVLMGGYGALASLYVSGAPALAVLYTTGMLPADVVSVLLFRVGSGTLVYLLGLQCVWAFEAGRDRWRQRGKGTATQ